jgi:tetratricopeptide (TPR) repeat protein
MDPNQNNFFEEEEYSDIINRYKDMLRKNRSCFFDIYEFENIIDYYILNNDYKSALKSVRTGLNQHPYSISLKLKYALVLIEDKKSRTALEILNEIEKVDSHNFEFHLIKGKALNSLKRTEEATGEFDKAIKLSQEDKDDVIYEIALSFIQINRIKTAINYLLLAYEINDTNLLVIYDLAICYERLDNIEKSIYFLEKYLDIDPYSENIWYNLGLLYSSVNKYRNALRAYDFAIAICPEFILAYMSKADTHISNNNYYEAIEVYQEIMEIDKKNAQLFCNIGDCYEKLGNFKTAIENYNKAIKIENDCSDAWYRIGVINYRLMKYTRSIAGLKKAIKIKPDISEYWVMLGKVYAVNKYFSKAVNAYNHSVKLDPGNYEAWLACANIYYNNNKIVNAIRILEESYQHNYNISIINYYLAAYYIYNEQPDLSYKYFEKGLLLNFKEHKEVLLKFPKTRENDKIRKLIFKYQNLKQTRK